MGGVWLVFSMAWLVLVVVLGKVPTMVYFSQEYLPPPLVQRVYSVGSCLTVVALAGLACIVFVVHVNGWPVGGYDVLVLSVANFVFVTELLVGALVVRLHRWAAGRWRRG